MRAMLKIAFVSIIFVFLNGFPNAALAETEPQYGPWESTGSYSPSRYRENDRARYRDRQPSKPQQSRSRRRATVENPAPQTPGSQRQSIPPQRPTNDSRGASASDSRAQTRDRNQSSVRSDLASASTVDRVEAPPMPSGARQTGT